MLMFKCVQLEVQRKLQIKRLKIVYAISTCRFIVVLFKIKRITILTSDPWMLHTQLTINVCMYVYTGLCVCSWKLKENNSCHFSGITNIFSCLFVYMQKVILQDKFLFLFMFYACTCVHVCSVYVDV